MIGRPLQGPLQCASSESGVNSNKSASCWSGGTGRRTGLKSQPNRARDGKLRTRLRRSRPWQPAVTPFPLGTITEPLQSAKARALPNRV